MPETFPVEVYPDDSAIEALAGTIDQPTGLEFIPQGLSQNSSPTYRVRAHRIHQRLAMLAKILNEGRAVETGALAIGVFPIDYRIANTNKHYAGATGQLVTDDDTNYVYIDSANALVINTTGFPADPTTYVPLATVVAVNGVLAILDKRHLILWTVAQPAGAFSSTSLSNLAATTAINRSLVPDSAGTRDLGDATKAFRIMYIGSQIIFVGATANVTLDFFDPAAAWTAKLPLINIGGTHEIVIADAGQTQTGSDLDTAVLKNSLDMFAGVGTSYTWLWDTPAANRTITVPDPGADAELVLSKGATLDAPTIADQTNMNHTHADAAGGGNLSETAFNGAKLFPFAANHFEAGNLTVSTLKWQFRAPFDLTIRNASGRVGTAPTDASAIIDILVDGASIFANQTQMINILSTEVEDTSDTKNHAVTAGQVVTIEIEQVGSTVAGADLTVVLNCSAAAATAA